MGKRSTNLGAAENARRPVPPPKMARMAAHAVFHPTRLDILCSLFERVASPNELARELRVDLSSVSHHVAELVKDEAIELVKEVPRRGSIEHYYRAVEAPELSDEEYRSLPKAVRRGIAAIALQGILAEGLASLRHGRMETDDDLNLIWMPMRLNPEACKEVSDLQAEVSRRLNAIKKKCDEQQDGDESRPVRIAAMMWFERGGPNSLRSMAHRTSVRPS